MSSGEIMENETAIVTGAGRGIGKAVAIKLAKEGKNVVINYSSSEEDAKKVAAECESYGVKTLTVKGDVSNPEDCDRIIKLTKETFGRIEVLVNNAGVIRD